jgi:hypothetical protein
MIYNFAYILQIDVLTNCEICINIHSVVFFLFELSTIYGDNPNVK